MSRADWLAIVGIILTLAFGIPPILEFFANEQTAIGVLAAIILAIVVAGILLARWYLSLPDYTLVKVEKSLTLHDKEGHSATQVSNMRVRANSSGQRQFDFRVLGADGTITNFLIDDEQPSRVRPYSGGTEIVKEFSVPWGRFDKRDVKVSFDCIDTFPGTTEAWTHTVAFATKEMHLRIESPPERPCLSASASLRYGDRPHGPLPGVVRTGNGRTVELTVNRPKLGAQYTIEWRW